MRRRRRLPPHHWIVLTGNVLSEPVTASQTTRFTLAISDVLGHEADGLMPVQMPTGHTVVCRGDRLIGVGDLRPIPASGFGEFLRNGACSRPSGSSGSP